MQSGPCQTSAEGRTHPQNLQRWELLITATRFHYRKSFSALGRPLRVSDHVKLKGTCSIAGDHVYLPRKGKGGPAGLTFPSSRITCWEGVAVIGSVIARCSPALSPAHSASNRSLLVCLYCLAYSSAATQTCWQMLAGPSLTCLMAPMRRSRQS